MGSIERKCNCSDFSGLITFDFSLDKLKRSYKLRLRIRICLLGERKPADQTESYTASSYLLDLKLYFSLSLSSHCIVSPIPKIVHVPLFLKVFCCCCSPVSQVKFAMFPKTHGRPSLMSPMWSPGRLLAFIFCGRDSCRLSWRGVACRTTWLMLLASLYYSWNWCLALIKRRPRRDGGWGKTSAFHSLRLQPYFSRHYFQSDNVPTVQILIFFRDTEI